MGQFSRFQKTDRKIENNPFFFPSVDGYSLIFRHKSEHSGHARHECELIDLVTISKINIKSWLGYNCV